MRSLLLAEEGDVYSQLAVSFPGCPLVLAVPVLRRTSPGNGLLVALPAGSLPADMIVASDVPRYRGPICAYGEIEVLAVNADGDACDIIVEVLDLGSTGFKYLAAAPADLPADGVIFEDGAGAACWPVGTSVSAEVRAWLDVTAPEAVARVRPGLEGFVSAEAMALASDDGGAAPSAPSPTATPLRASRRFWPRSSQSNVRSTLASPSWRLAAGRFFR